MKLTCLFLRMASTTFLASTTCAEAAFAAYDAVRDLDIHDEWSTCVLVAFSMVGLEEVEPIMFEREPTMSLGRVGSGVASISLSSCLREAFVCLLREFLGFDEELDVGRGVGVSVNEAYWGD